MSGTSAGAGGSTPAPTAISATALAALFTAIYGFTTQLTVEGIYSNVASDSGNYYQGKLIGSKYGISAPLAAAWLAVNQPGTALTVAWMKALTLDQAATIAKPGFWDKMWLNRLAPISPGMCLQCFDHGYNRGVYNGGRPFQAMVGIPAQDQDGILGPATIAAYQAASTMSLAKHLTGASVKAIQAAIGLAGKSVDGSYGPQTDGIVIKGTYKNLVAIYALHDLQYRDYQSLAGASENGGWFTRCDSRVPAAINLESSI